MEAGLRDAQPAGQYLHGALAAKNEAGAEGAFRSWLPWPLSAAAGAASAQGERLYNPPCPTAQGPQHTRRPMAPAMLRTTCRTPTAGMPTASAAPAWEGEVRMQLPRRRQPQARLAQCAGAHASPRAASSWCAAGICVASRCQHAHQICRHICVDAGCSALHCLAGGQASSILQGWARLSRRHGMHSLMVLCHEPAADRWHPLPEG